MKRIIKSGPNILLTFKLNAFGIEQTAIELSKNGCEWRIEGSHPKHEKLIDEWMNDYCQKKEPTVILPIDLIGGGFTLNVMRKIQKVPFGQTTTYKEMAEKTGSPRAARAVGNVCGSNPFLVIIPCHRVLATGNKIGGFGDAGIEVKKELLAFEGHTEFKM